ncbi:MAG: secretin and TonB N-terminal domain-containing protein [Thermodesulfobacteriota bacterium]|nr:secretin and TonB N-terminal domain-containing protein [Thermodesulfobacteriota bacterium]
MKAKMLFISFLCLLWAVGCAAPPKKERTQLPSQKVEPSKPQPPPEEKLKELVIPQREEAKKVPEKLYSFFARDSNIQDILLAFSKESDYNIVIDPELSGKVTIDLKRVTLKEALDAILFPLGWIYRIEGKFIKIMRPQLESRFFTLNYLATKRSGKREIYASTGGGLQTGALPGTQASTSSSGTRTGFSDLVSVDEMDLWRDIQKGLEAIVFGSVEEKTASDAEKVAWTRVDGKGKKLIINKSTGVILVTDYPINLNKIASYLETVEGSSQRQVTIQAKIFEVILSDENKEGINWKVIEGLPRSVNLAWGLTDKIGTTGFPGGSTTTSTITALGTTTAGTIQAPGTFKIKPFGGTLAIGAGDVALSDIMQAIAEQGDVKVLSSPMISTLNNQKAIIRVGNQDVFFITGAVATQTTVTQIIQPMTIDVGIILDVTPQIAEDGTIIMNIHPSITEKTGEKVTPDGRTTFPLLSVRETDTTVRVKDGQTIIIAGLMQEKNEESYIGVPVLHSIPLLGGLFRYRTEKKRIAELVIMITPTLQVGKKVEDFTNKSR